MVPRRYSSEAIVLARRNFSEADRILTVYSKHYGKITLIAKGVRKPKSRKRGSIEVFSYIKFSAARGKNLDIVTEVELIDSLKEIRSNLKKTSVAYYFVEAVNKLTKEGEENKPLFYLLADHLKSLKVSKNLKKLRLDFIYRLLVLLGYWPKGKKLEKADEVIEEITERELNSKRVGRRILS
jgi:DNA repair protein RecO (recombination protein O)